MRAFTIGLIVLAVGCAIVGSTYAGNLYRWRDANGVIHVSDEPPPRGTTNSVEEIDAAPPPNPPKKQTAKKKTAPTPVVVLYTTAWCGYCQKAKAYLKQQGVSYTEHDIEKDPVAARKRRALDARRGVPLAVINGTPILGFDPKAYQRALKRQ